MKQSGGLFHRPWENPLVSGRTPCGCGQKSSLSVFQTPIITLRPKFKGLPRQPFLFFAVISQEVTVFFGDLKISLSKGGCVMGYRIDYNGGTVVKKPIYAPKVGKKKIVLLSAAVLTAAFLLWPMGRRCVRDLLLPGDEDVTAAALSELVNDLSAGEPVGEAVEAFCRDIIADEE